MFKDRGTKAKYMIVTKEDLSTLLQLIMDFLKEVQTHARKVDQCMGGPKNTLDILQGTNILKIHKLVIEELRRLGDSSSSGRRIPGESAGRRCPHGADLSQADGSEVAHGARLVMRV